MQLSEVFQYALFGVGIGAIYALAAQGLILIYRGSGVINFAQGSLALAGAAVYTELRDQLPVAAAAIVGVAVAAVGGALIQVLVMYPLRRSSPLTRLVATLGLLIFIDQMVTLHYNHGVVFVPSLLPTFPVHFGSGVIVGVDRLILFGIACALTLVLWLVYRFTPFGIATSAVAENERAAASLGHSPPLIAAINWTLGGGLAGLAGVLLVGITGLDPVALPIIVVIALAGALVGGFSSFPLALVGALLIGILEAELTRYVSAPGWSESVPFLVIIAVLVIRGKALPQRSHLQELLPDLGTGRVRLWLVVPAVAVWVVLLEAFTNDWAAAVASTMVMAIVCLSVVVVTGYCGQLSLAQFALAGVGAYISARLAAVYGIPFPLAMLIGVAGTIPVGVAIAIPAMRTRGVNLAVVTIGLALVIEKLLLNNTANTGGILGTTVPEPTIFGFSVFSITHPVRYATLTIGVFVVAALLVANLRRGAAGRRLLAVRANERAAACLGINVVGAKLYAFGLGAGIAASAGVLLAFRTPHVEFERFGGLQSIYAVVNAVIGGVGFLFGAFMGGTFADQGVTQEILTNYGDAYRYVTIASGALLVLVVMFNPNGLASEQVRHMRRLGSAMRRLPLLRRLPIREARPWLLTAPTASARRHPSTLEVSSISVSFGGVEALVGVSLSVHPGEVVGLIGPNGAGKTALIDVITGITRNYRGNVLLDGTALDRRSAHRRARAGIGRSFQSLDLFEDQTVLENFRTASDQRHPLAYVTDLAWPVNRPLPPAAAAAIHELGLLDTLDRRPGELSHGRRRLVSIARALAAAPSVLLLDEPAAGLDDESVANLGRLIRRLADHWGLAILVVEHDMRLVMQICDQIIALDFGRQICQGAPHVVRSDAALVAAYLGEPDEPADHAGAAAAAHAKVETA